MDELRIYLNSLPIDKQAAFALACNTSVRYLRKACSKGQELGPALSSAIERESGGVVTRKHLHPNDYQLKWPELAEAA